MSAIRIHVKWMNKACKFSREVDWTVQTSILVKTYALAHDKQSIYLSIYQLRRFISIYLSIYLSIKQTPYHLRIFSCDEML